MAMTNGWGGTILHVDLTTRKIEKEPLSRDFAMKYIGGSGFMARILYDEVGPEVDPLSPENICLIGQGPLNGTLAPSSGRYEVGAKSPMTGIYGRSNGGGNFGPEMKWAGYDLIVVRGKSESPVYLWIEDDHVELRDARPMWGQPISKSRRFIFDDLGDPDIATLLIGPAGENLCFTSCIIGDLTRAAGKNSIAAVWGSKNLKGVAVRGSKGVNIARPAEFMQLCKTLYERLKEDPLYDTHSKYGTLSWVGSAYSRSPVGKTLTGGMGAPGLEDKAFDKLIEKNLACCGCPIHCGHFLHVKEGKYKGAKGEGLEGNVQMWGIGLKTLNAEFLTEYNNLCNELGLNVDGPAIAIQFGMRLWEAGIINKEDTDGIELTWGNEDAVLEMTRKIACKEGFGEVLDSWPLRAGKKIGRGAEMYASHNKGSYSYNVGPGLGTALLYTLSLNVATRGFDHLTGSPTVLSPDFRTEWGITRELLTKYGQERYGDPTIATDAWGPNPKKARVVFDFENSAAMTDMLGICVMTCNMCFIVAGLDLKDMGELLTAATGETFTTDDLLQASERQFALQRSYNAREGIRRIDDYPFYLRWLIERGEPNPIFDYKQLPLTQEVYDILLDEYYRVRGCDLKTGIPTGEHLKKLGLEDVADDLAKRGVNLKAKKN